MFPAPANPDKLPRPIAVDLDGTLLAGDSMEMALEWMWKHKPWRMLQLMVTKASAGRAEFKWSLYSEVKLGEVAFNLPLIKWLEEHKTQKRRIILASAAPQFWADEMAARINHLSPHLIDETLGSTRTLNRRSKKKAAELTARFGPKGFDYVGNSQADIAVWKAAAAAYNVNPSKALKTAAAAEGLALVTLAENPQAELMERWDDFLRSWKYLRWFLLAALIILFALISCGGQR